MIHLRDLTPQSSGESTKAATMCVSLTSFWFKRRHSFSAGHQTTSVTATEQSWLGIRHLKNTSVVSVCRNII